MVSSLESSEFDSSFSEWKSCKWSSVVERGSRIAKQEVTCQIRAAVIGIDSRFFIDAKARLPWMAPGSGPFCDTA